MRILLDENLDWRLKRGLEGFQVDSVPRIGWGGISNGNLLARAQLEYDVLITIDQGIPHQNALANFDLAVVGLKAKSNRLADTLPLMTEVLNIIATVEAGRICRVG